MKAKQLIQITIAAIIILSTVGKGWSDTLLSASFDSSSQGFGYDDDAFLGTNNPGYASGGYVGSGGFSGGGLHVALGGIDRSDIIDGMSGGWSTDFNVMATGPVTIELRYRLIHVADSDECGQALLSVDGNLLSPGPNDYLQLLCGQGSSTVRDSGWQRVSITRIFSAGTHTLTVGGYLSKKTFTDETTDVYVDDVLITDSSSSPESNCSNDIDDDGDNLIDCDDNDCNTDPACTLPNTETDCSNDFDDDGDSLIDCDDNDCDTDPACTLPNTETDCSNDFDDDGDNLIDCDDGDCSADPACSGGAVLLSAGFDGSSQGFGYDDDTFRATGSPGYASGNYTGNGGFSGGGLQVTLGGIDRSDIFDGMSGGWSADLNVTTAGPVTIELRYRLVHAGNFDPGECGQALVAVDGNLLSPGADDYLGQFCGQGDGSPTQDSGWQQVSITTILSAGPHTLTVGGYLSQKTFTDETTDVYVDDVMVTGASSASETDCANDIDDDGDSLIDCDDNDCDTDPACTLPTTETDCSNDFDDDGDSLIDCDDNDCDTDPACTLPNTETDCSNDFDDDGDSLVDCDDSDCNADPACSGGAVLLSAGFDGSSQGFGYDDDTFRATNSPGYASGSYTGTGGFSGGGLQVALGGMDGSDIFDGMSGGWSTDFTVTTTGPVTISLRYRLVHAGDFEPNECSEALVAVDGTLLSPGTGDYLRQLCGQGDGSPTQDSGWQQISLTTTLSAGIHTITVGGYLNQKTTANEIADIIYDDILIEEVDTQSLFLDDFEDGNANGWTIVDDSGKVSDWQVTGGLFTQFNDRVDGWQESYHLGSYAYVDQSDIFNLSDYHVSVKARSLSDPSGLRDDLGIMIRYQDENNYVRLSISKMQGFIRLEKQIGGVFSTLAFTGRPPQLGSLIDIQVDVTGDQVLVFINQEPLFGVSDPDLSTGNVLASGSIALYTQSRAEFDDVLINEIDALPKVVIASPMAYSVARTDETPGPYPLIASAVAKDLPAGGGIRFILDSATPCDDYAQPYDTTNCPSASGFSDVAAGDHRVEALIVDNNGQPISPNGSARDVNEGIGIAGKYLVLMGDSILNGVGDDSDDRLLETQDDAANGKNLNRGVAPILNDLISDQLSLPVVVYNEGLGGTTSQQGLDRRVSTTQRHTQSVWLILFGQNDSSVSINLPDGSTCSESDFQNNEPSCIGTYKYYMREIILDLKGLNKIPVLAEVPYAKNAPQNQLDLIQKYNQVVAQLTAEHQLPADPPQFYSYFFDHQTTDYFDDIHPNGMGYSSMAKMWFCELIPGVIEGNKPAYCSAFPQ